MLGLLAHLLACMFDHMLSSKHRLCYVCAVFLLVRYFVILSLRPSSLVCISNPFSKSLLLFIMFACLLVCLCAWFANLFAYLLACMFFVMFAHMLSLKHRHLMPTIKL